MYKGVTVKVLLDSGIIGMFIDWKMVAKYGFKAAEIGEASNS